MSRDWKAAASAQLQRNIDTLVFRIRATADTLMIPLVRLAVIVLLAAVLYGWMAAVAGWLS